MSQQIIIEYWVEKARDDLASARDNRLSAKSNIFFQKYIDIFRSKTEI